MTTPTTRGLRVWHALAAAFAARLAVGLATDTVLQPDEVMQYLEQAHRFVFGAGMIPWEYDYGTRTWAPTLLIAAVLELARLVGLDAPQWYQPMVKAALSAASLAIPYSAYRIGRALWSEDAAWLALLFTSFWYELVTYGHRPTNDALAAYPTFLALALLFDEPRRRVTIGCGFFAGLAFVVRYQLAPALAVIGLLAIWRWRWRAWPAVLVALLLAVAGGALDAYTWGVWFGSIVVSVGYNFGQNLMVRFGTQPYYWYAVTMLVLSGGLCVVGGLGLLRSWRSSWPLVVVGAVAVAAFSAAAHKEPRFVFLATPIWLMGLARLTAVSGRVAGTVLIVVFAAASLLGLDNRLPYQRRYMRDQVGRVATREAYRALAAQTDVIAVLDLSDTDGDSSWYLTPYYDLHHDVPLYWPLGRGFTEASLAPSRYASHVISPPREAPPPGFRAWRQIRGLTIWRRLADPPFTPEPFGYDRRIAALQPVTAPPKVTPRW